MIIFLKIISRELDNFIYLYIKKIHSIGKCVSKITLTMTYIFVLYQMNIRKVLEKVIEWQAAAGQLKPYLPPGDQVLSYWFTCLGEFKKDLPILHKLANDALKVRRNHML